MFTKTFASCFTVCSALLAVVELAALPAQGQTFTQMKPVSATSSVNSADAPNTIDRGADFLQTFWQAAADPEACVTYDLGSTQALVGFRETSGTFPANPFTAFASSDDVAYAQVATGNLTHTTVGTHTFPLNNARYLKLCIQRTDDAGFGELVDFRALVFAGPYTITDLGDLGGGVSIAFGIDGHGHVVGGSTTSAGDFHAFVYRNGAMQDLGVLPGTTTSAAFGINDADRVVGYSSDGANLYLGFVHDGLVMSDLGSLGGSATQAFGINTAGQVVGNSYISGPPGEQHLFRTSPNATINPATDDLGLLQGAVFGNAVNNAGDVVGRFYRSTSSNGFHAFRTPGTRALIPSLDDLGVLSGNPINSSEATSVNNLGEVVGSSQIDFVSEHPFVSAGGVMTDLGTLGGNHSGAFEINDAGVAVGSSNDRAFIWDGANGLRDLGTFLPSGTGWYLLEARAVNESGQIAGSGFRTSGRHAYLLSPPASDLTAPAVQCASPDGTWHPFDVSMACTASDAGSGLANPSDASFSLLTAVAPGDEASSASTASRSVCDVSGNCATAGPIAGNMVDRKAPAVSITSPTGTTYQLNQAVSAAYACSDGGSGVASCAGPTASGSLIDTSTLGAHFFTVNTSDLVGNTAANAVAYDVRRTLTAVGPAKLWIGLKNSDDVGLRLDVLAEVLANDVVVGLGELDNVGAGSGGFNNALSQAVAMTLDAGPVDVPAGATLGLRTSVRRTCSGGGHNVGTARFWFNGQPIDSGAGRDAGSRVSATMAGTASDYFARSGSVLSTAYGTARQFVDVTVNSSAACPARPFTAFGAWTLTLP